MKHQENYLYEESQEPNIIDGVLITDNNIALVCVAFIGITEIYVDTDEKLYVRYYDCQSFQFILWKMCFNTLEHAERAVEEASYGLHIADEYVNLEEQSIPEEELFKEPEEKQTLVQPLFINERVIKKEECLHYKPAIHILNENISSN